MPLSRECSYFLFQSVVAAMIKSRRSARVVSCRWVKYMPANEVNAPTSAPPRADSAAISAVSISVPSCLGFVVVTSPYRGTCRRGNALLRHIPKAGLPCDTESPRHMPRRPRDGLGLCIRVTAIFAPNGAGQAWVANAYQPVRAALCDVGGYGILHMAQTFLRHHSSLQGEHTCECWEKFACMI